MKKLKISEIQKGDKASFSRSITAEMIQAFATLTGDQNPLHTSPEFAQKKGFRDVVAHGLLTSSFFSTLAGMHLPGENSLIMNTTFNFVLPVYGGDLLTFHSEVIEVNAGFEFINLNLECTNQNGLQVIRGTMRVGVKE